MYPTKVYLNWLLLYILDDWCYAAVQIIPSTVRTIPSTVRTIPSTNNMVRTISTTDSYLNSGKTYR